MQMSSTIVPVCGRKSESHVPLRPCCENFVMEGNTTFFACPPRHRGKPLSLSDGTRNLLSCVIHQLRFLIEQIDVGGSTRLHQVNHPFCFWRKMRKPGQRHAVRSNRSGFAKQILVHQRRQCCSANSHCTAAKEGATRHQQFAVLVWVHITLCSALRPNSGSDSRPRYRQPTPPHSGPRCGVSRRCSPFALPLPCPPRNSTTTWKSSV